MNGHAEEVEEKKEVKLEQAKEAESHSNASADTEVLLILYVRLLLLTPQHQVCFQMHVSPVMPHNTQESVDARNVICDTLIEKTPFVFYKCHRQWVQKRYLSCYNNLLK